MKNTLLTLSILVLSISTLFGQNYDKISNYGAYHKDLAWAALNSVDFQYGQGGSAVQSVPNIGSHSHPMPGFISRYSASGLEEDKAVVF